MPKLYEYLGLVLKFWSNEHEPIHIHVISKDGRECKVIFYLKEKRITKIIYKNVNGKKALTLPQSKNFSKSRKIPNNKCVDQFFYLQRKGKLKKNN